MAILFSSSIVTFTQNDFIFFDDVASHPVGTGLYEIDHLTHNVYKGRMQYWADFYEKIFNFQEIRYFDIKGEYTGLTSQGTHGTRWQNPYSAQ